MSVKEIRQKKLGKQSETGMEIDSLGLEKQRCLLAFARAVPVEY